MLTAIVFEGPGNINSVFWGTEAELTLEEFGEGGTPGGRVGNETDEKEPTTRVAEAWMPQSPIS